MNRIKYQCVNVLTGIVLGTIISLLVAFLAVDTLLIRWFNIQTFIVAACFIIFCGAIGFFLGFFHRHPV